MMRGITRLCVPIGLTAVAVAALVTATCLRPRPYHLASSRVRALAPVPTSAEDQAWEVVAQRHPHAGLPGWSLKPGFTSWGYCMPPPGRSTFFVRALPENGALTQDWAEVFIERGQVRGYEQGRELDALPAAVLRQPGTTAGQAWQRAATELAACGCRLPRANRVPRHHLQLAAGGNRLAYRFHPADSYWNISVDALTGEVGALTRSLTNAIPLRSDPLEPSRRPRPGHRLYRLKSGWVRTRSRAG